MKHLMAILFLIAFNFSFSQYTKDRYHIKDSLAKYHVSSYSIYETQNDGKDSTLIETLYFDQNGNLIKEVEPKYNITETYKYDSLQRLIEYTDVCPGIVNEIEYSYYESDKLVKKIRKDSTGFINQIVECFYEDSRLAKEHIVANYKSRGVSSTSDILYEYDSTGLQITELIPAYSIRTEIIKNEYGGIIYFKMKSNPRPTYYTYDKNMRTEEYHYFNDNKVVVERMIYDKQGRILEIQSCEDGPCTTTRKFHYTYYSK